MLKSGDLSRPVQVRVHEGRDWRWLWLRRRSRLVFAGYIETVSSKLGGGTEMVLVDAVTRLYRRMELDGSLRTVILRDYRSRWGVLYGVHGTHALTLQTCPSAYGHA